MSNFKLNETQLVCVAEFKAKKGEADQLLTNLHSLIKFTLQEGDAYDMSLINLSKRLKKLPL